MKLKINNNYNLYKYNSCQFGSRTDKSKTTKNENCGLQASDTISLKHLSITRDGQKLYSPPDMLQPGIPTRVLSVHNQRMQNKNRKTNLMYDAFHDQLTGLRNKEYLLCRMPQIIDNAKKNGNEIAIAMFDMDNFKSVNELLGYETGDKFIEEIAGFIREEASKNNLGAYRFGGEEFVIVFKNSDYDFNTQICQNILDSVSKAPNLNDYIETYLNNGRKKLEVMKFEDKKMSKLREERLNAEFYSRHYKDFIKETGAENSPYAFYDINKLAYSSINLADKLSEMIEDLLSKEQNQVRIKKLKQTHEQCLTIKSLSDSYSSIEKDFKKEIQKLGKKDVEFVFENRTKAQEFENSGNTKYLSNMAILMRIANQLYKAANLIIKETEKLVQNENLFRYLDSKYNHDASIVQMEAWLKNIETSKSFTLTCGIKNFNKNDMESKEPLEMVNETGEVLKKGKNTKKGRIYMA